MKSPPETAGSFFNPRRGFSFVGEHALPPRACSDDTTISGSDIGGTFASALRFSDRLDLSLHFCALAIKL